jgi:hypothetical protein
MNPQNRISAAEALKHKYFFGNPLPTELAQMPKIGKECRVLDLKIM